ncbi:MAG: exodeoxyribonuclease VII small subunit, partial [Rhabdochlamydiaceae bacterium]
FRLKSCKSMTRSVFSSRMAQSRQKFMKFEEAYQRLEEILQAMNSGKVALDDSLTLYEEADKLIASCQKKLTEAEKKIEILVKNRSGELSTDETGAPFKETFIT